MKNELFVFLLFQIYFFYSFFIFNKKNNRSSFLKKLIKIEYI